MADDTPSANGSMAVADQTPTFDGPTSLVDQLRAAHLSALAAEERAERAVKTARAKLVELTQAHKDIVAEERAEDERHRQAKADLKSRKDKVLSDKERTRTKRDESESERVLAHDAMLRAAGALRAYEAEQAPRDRTAR